MMKYTINHPWKFEHWFVAFIINLMQVGIVMLVEIISILIILLQDSVIDVLMNFISLAIVT